MRLVITISKIAFIVLALALGTRLVMGMRSGRMPRKRGILGLSLLSVGLLCYVSAMVLSYYGM